MALRIPKAELPADLRASMTEQLGAVPEPVEVTYHHPEVALASQEFSAGVATWDTVDAGLKTLVDRNLRDDDRQLFLDALSFVLQVGSVQEEITTIGIILYELCDAKGVTSQEA